jgi:transketolase
MTHRVNSSHIASVFSCADIIAVLYTTIMKIDPANPKEDTRDRFILSKGHAGVAVYIALSKRGFFQSEELTNFYSNGSTFSGHISHKKVPGVELSTGSLGHGMSVAAGMALAGKMNNQDYQVYVLVGDGECDEGSIWEAALFSNHFRLDNLTVIVDRNKMQSLDYCENTIKIEPFLDKWKSFGFYVVEVDGHDHDKIIQAFYKKVHGKPKCIVANTIKGKGVSFMENNIIWHYRSPQNEYYLEAIRELEEKRP